MSSPRSLSRLRAASLSLFGIQKLMSRLSLRSHGQTGNATTGKASGGADTVIAWDGVSHHALGGGSYAFKERFPEYLFRLIQHGPHVEVNVIIQPNSSPHFGTLVSMALTFSLAYHLRLVGLDPVVVVDLWDNAKAEQLIIDGVVYQRGLRQTGKLLANLDDYHEILGLLHAVYGVPYTLRMEKDFLSQPGIPAVVRDIIRDRVELGVSLAPSSGVIALRAACPHDSCGLVDKYGSQNVYDEAGDCVHFVCPVHGRFTVRIADQCHQLQFNCQLFNLVIGRFYEDYNQGYVQICGSDYAGFWQEQLLWRNLRKPLVIVYTPLILDWSGSKLSKSLYLQKDAYDYLRDAGLEYMLSYKQFRAEGRDIKVICDEVDLWIKEPFRLFRSYSVHYMHMLFSQDDALKLGVIHLRDRVNNK